MVWISDTTYFTKSHYMSCVKWVVTDFDYYFEKNVSHTTRIDAIAINI
ncbi:hypothetical protein HMPREF9104_02349 [Lentilactobacillus kisonensis F0435]|uniref:Uncharacterized protein n=1 Tax=Lentilactobacillus kisonensis F0435 TaxID=797516 RepID=H1LIA8_9LACO|nr:hypothetical protein HMPREF9104_02349 [Lentilactobacillus kisonensis F0435]